MLDGIIFDVDGTLWDARKQVGDAWFEAKYNLTGVRTQWPFEKLSSMFGRPMTDIYLALFPEYPEEKALEYGERCFDAELESLRHNPGIVFDGVREMLVALKKRCPLYIVSNCQCGYIDILLESGDLGGYFSDFLCYGDTRTSKGKTIRTLMERNGLENVIYIGDTQGDADACAEAEIPFLFAAYGFGAVERDYPTAKTVRDIPLVVEQMDR
ncbi:MAG: HAD family hydrolase [Eubacteriales bacterium]|nr:HAD family hydrolase [Eubacteriales bacterium]